MKKRRNLIRRITQLVLALVIVALPVVGKPTQGRAKVDQQPPPLIRSLKGSDLFQSYCASCHGLDGRGTGPAAPALKTKVPDLTILTRVNRGKFPVDHVRQVILGDLALPAHGSREMPPWGPVFHHVQRDMDWGEVRVSNLVEYLRSIQLTDGSKIPSGEVLYAQDCAICHGSNLRGTGSVPYPFRNPPDLTTLTRRHGGNFPDAYLADILRNGVVLPAHGPAQMPIWGTDFTKDQWDERQLAARIANLTNFLKSRQVK